VNELSFNNNIDFAKESGFEFVEINKDNYKEYLSEKTKESVGKVLLMLQQRAETE
jgi:L-ribulose-5-phosphate 3-epimerase UlaE